MIARLCLVLVLASVTAVFGLQKHHFPSLITKQETKKAKDPGSTIQASATINGAGDAVAHGVNTDTPWLATIGESILGLIRKETGASTPAKAEEKSSQHAEAQEAKAQTRHHRGQRQSSSTRGAGSFMIPPVVFLTGKYSTLEKAMQARGRNGTKASGKFERLESLGINKYITVKYFNNSQCRDYLAKYKPDLVSAFDNETHGSYRADMCRAAVLAREGGYYVDMDMQLKSPLTSLVDPQTTFMTGLSYIGGFLNAIMATVPDNPIMLKTLDSISKYYHSANRTRSRLWLLGTQTLFDGVNATMRSQCPKVSMDFRHSPTQFQCGHVKDSPGSPQQHIRILKEVHFGRGTCKKWGDVICPPLRANLSRRFDGLNYGLFTGHWSDMALIQKPTATNISTHSARLVAWPRIEQCDHYGCGMNGGTPS